MRNGIRTIGVVVLVGCADAEGTAGGDAGVREDAGTHADASVDDAGSVDAGADAGTGGDGGGSGISSVLYDAMQYPLDGFNTAGLPGANAGLTLNGGGTGGVPYYQLTLTLTGVPVAGTTYDCEGGAVSGSLAWNITNVGSWNTTFDMAESSCAITFTQVPAAVGDRFVGTFTGTLSSTTAGNQAVTISGTIDEPRDF